jgi:hypothetical protein
MEGNAVKSARPVAALFVTCTADLFPLVGFAAAHLIERCGFAVEVPVRRRLAVALPRTRDTRDPGERDRQTCPPGEAGRAALTGLAGSRSM